MKYFKNILIIELDTVNSTNDYAKQLLETDNVKELTVIYAKNQTDGRGQQGNKWFSDSDNNLTISIVLFPTFLPPENQFLLNKTVTLAVHQLICEQTKLNAAVKIKWPNDIYIGNKKVAGILIENSISGITWNYCIIGIGININQEKFPKTIPNPTSFKLETGKMFQINIVLECFLETFINYYRLLQNGEIEIINKEYLSALYQYQELKKYQIKKKIVEAKIIGISEFGKLVLLTKANDIIECDFKEVIYL